MTKQQEKAFEMGRLIVNQYANTSADHSGANLAVVAGDLIADVIWTMTEVFGYDRKDIESVTAAALGSLLTK